MDDRQPLTRKEAEDTHYSAINRVVGDFANGAALLLVIAASVTRPGGRLGGSLV